MCSVLVILTIKLLQSYQNFKTSVTFHGLDLRYSGPLWLYHSQITVHYSGFKYSHDLIIASLDVFVIFTTESSVRSLGLFFLVLFTLSFCLTVFTYSVSFQSGTKSLDISPLNNSVVFSSKNGIKTLSSTYEKWASLGHPTRFHMASRLATTQFLFSAPASPCPFHWGCWFSKSVMHPHQLPGSFNIQTAVWSSPTILVYQQVGQELSFSSKHFTLELLRRALGFYRPRH